jgi:hypothetical protein
METEGEGYLNGEDMLRMGPLLSQDMIHQSFT